MDEHGGRTGDPTGTGDRLGDRRERLGSVRRDEGRLALCYERMIAHPPEKVWRALTESDSLQHWFPADIVGERRAGAQVQLPFWPEGAKESAETLAEAGVDTSDFDFDEVLPGEIRSWDPPKLFELVWGNPTGVADVLRFELEPAGEGTRLVFTTWPGEPGPMGNAGTAAGWHVCLDALESVLDTGTPGTSDKSRALELQKAYGELIDAV